MSSSRYIDAHCHLADPAFRSDLEAILNRSEKAGVVEWVQGGIGPDDWETQKKIAKLRLGKIHLAFGIHPWWLASHSEGEVISAIKQLETELPNAQFLGELGLDYLPKYKAKAEIQKEIFRAQLLLNEIFKKPLVLHIVQAHSDALAILKESSSRSGLVHAFSEGKDVLRKYLDLGFLISVGEAVTRKGFQKLKDALPFIPADRLVVETDACEGRNEPETLISIAQAISQIRKDLSVEAILEVSSRNLRPLLGSPTNE
ncbi:MAG: TatD family hydrolase [Pseudomonadota bacterium]